MRAVNTSAPDGETGGLQLGSEGISLLQATTAAFCDLNSLYFLQSKEDGGKKYMCATDYSNVTKEVVVVRNSFLDIW